MSNNSLKTALLRSTILVGVAAFAAPAFGQGTAKAVTATDTAAAGDEEIIVTGSLIKNPALERSSPVTVTSSDEIELKQSNSAEEVIREIPGVVPSIGQNTNNGNNGNSFVDLRGLGPKRNLVLLDGNRLAPSGLGGLVDLNDIPLAVIDRVENLTGGASTTYGADAVSGVVNFITKKDFSGVDISGSESITERGDGNQFRTDLTVGGNFDDDRGNVTLSIGYHEVDPVYQGARDFSAVQIESFNGTLGGSTTTVPTRFTGTRPIDPATGQPSIVPATANGGERQIQPATGQAIAPYFPFNFNPYNIFQTPFQRFNIFAQGHYDITDNVEFYSRALFSKSTTNTIIAPSGVFAQLVVIPLSNPYLPTALRNQFCAFNTAPLVGGVQVAYTPRFTPAECAAAATATSATDPNFRTVTTQIRRRTTEIGPRLGDYQTTIFDYKAGLRGKVTDSIDWDIGGSYGESEKRSSQQNYVLISRARAAIYATSTTTCLATGPNRTAGGAIADISAGPGCVPVNIFGPDGTIAANQIPYLTAEATVTTRTQLSQVHGTLSGDFGVTSPYASDAIGFAVGGEYRNYGAQVLPDTLSQQAGELGGAGGATPRVVGGYNVKEGYGELVAPLVQDAPFFESLTLEAGVRYSSYKVNAAGSPSYKTTTYKGGASWEPVSGIKIRGNYSHSVRAPNIGELFSPVSVGLTSLSTDPCAGAAPVANANLRAVCIAQGAPAGTIGVIANPAAGQANASAGGNINLRPERANTYTFGAVVQPKLIPGLSFTADYYNIKINGAVSSPTPGDVIAGCFGAITAASATDPACTTIRRNPTTGSLDGDPATTFGLPQVLSNLGKTKTTGIDATASYSHDIGFAKLGLSFTGNYTFDSKFQATPTSVNRECIGYYSSNCASPQPKFSWLQRTTLSFGEFDASLLWRHQDSLQQEPRDITGGNGPAFVGATPAAGPFGTVNFQRIKAFNYFDLSGRIGINDNVSFTVAVTNLLDKQPPITGTDISSSTYNGGNTFPASYDTLGRRFAVGAHVKF